MFFVPDGKINIKSEFIGTVIDEQLYIVPETYNAIAGRVWIHKFGVCLHNHDTPLCNGNLEKISDFVVVSLKLRKGAQPVFHRKRDVPYALMKKVDAELDTLEAEGVLTKAETSDWKTPLVVIPKADEGVRLCVDYQVGVNEQLQDAHHPIQKTYDILNSLRKFKGLLIKFCVMSQKLYYNLMTSSIVHGSTREECQHNLIASLDQLQKFDLHLNQQKCLLFPEQIEYLDHVIEFNKISKSQGKVAAIVDMPCPKSTEDVRRFLGIVTYYSRFIPGASTITTSLCHLFFKNTIFKWTSACEAAFQKLRQAIASDQVLVPYDPDLPVQLACDASSTGIARVLSHIIDGNEYPIAFASQSLTAAEQNYFQLDREAQAIIFTMTAGCLQRYAAFLSGFNYTIDFKKGNVDCLSRAPFNINSYTASAINNEVTQLCHATIKQISILIVPYQFLKEEMKKDATLSTIMKSLQEKITSEPNYIIESSILFHDQRVVVSASLQMCSYQEQVQPRHKVILGRNQNITGKQIHINYAGHYQDHHFLVVVDAKSKWAEIVPCSSAPTSKSSIEILKDIYSRNGFPEVMVLDNATIFTSEEFAQYCKEAGIFQKFCAAGHPVPNGLVECNVQMLKHRLATMSNQKMPIHQKFWEILSLPG
ncbi:hypothetical protein PR048_021647 [Dryococelus australis]|uniref:Integrase catalytic domain-containing protein n=1 Tax=Dryococelus australis TaxID=614101 RepID=A0ABQ9GZ00_9NEOP|nr:hypothetical protein PR048_021647 [Dryococelus australis]